MSTTWQYCRDCPDKKFNSGSMYQSHLKSKNHKLALEARRLSEDRTRTQVNPNTPSQALGKQDLETRSTPTMAIVSQSATVSPQVSDQEDSVVSLSLRLLQSEGEKHGPLPKCTKCGKAFATRDVLEEVRTTPSLLFHCRFRNDYTYLFGSSTAVRRIPWCFVASSGYTRRNFSYITTVTATTRSAWSAISGCQT